LFNSSAPDHLTRPPSSERTEEIADVAGPRFLKFSGNAVLLTPAAPPLNWWAID